MVHLFLVWPPLLTRPVRAQIAASRVIINEIHYRPPNATKSDEFIEFHNPGAGTVDLSNWRIDGAVQYAFPEGTSLGPGGYLVAAKDPAAFQVRFAFKPFGPWTGKLSHAGERIRLRDSGGNVVEEVNYGVGFPWPTNPAGGGALTSSGYSAELIHPSLDRDLGGSWRSSLPPGQAATVIYLKTNDLAWHYRKGTSEASVPTSAWRLKSFVEDNTWLVGQTSIGFGDEDDQTILTDMYGAYVSVFLRHPFNLAAGQIPGALRLRLRVDDGCIVWVNGVELQRAHMNTGNFAFNAENAAQNHEAGATAFEEFILPNAGAYLAEGTNLLAIQVFNSTATSGDLTIDAELSAAPGTTSPTPGRRNSVFATEAPPAIRQVAHSPAQPRSAEKVVITAKVTDPQGVSAVSLSYQIVEPGAYLRITDAAYSNPVKWVTVAMNDAGQEGDLIAGDSVFSASLPTNLQQHRRLIRYRLRATDAAETPLSVTVPYPDDESPNFAYFVYDGIPAWSGARKPTTPNQTPVINFPAEVMGSLRAYHLIANNTDVLNSQYNPGSDGVRMRGTLILNGKVYDHIQYANHGANSTYVSGKNKWRFRATRTRKFQLLDNYQHPYPKDWDEFNLEGCIAPWGAVNRGMAGVDEAVSLRTYQLAGVAAPNTHYFQFRVIDDAVEASKSSQYEGDLWGLYLAKETPDGSFLSERGLPEGNVYRIELNAPYQKNQGPTQPQDNSDWTTFLANTLSRTANNAANLQWWRTNLHLPTYYTGRAIDRLIGNIDMREGANYYFYHHPDGHWYYVPWDLDLVFIPTLMNSGVIDQKNCLLMAPLMLEYRNRAREILDLMGADRSNNGGQIGQLLDEYAQIVNPAGQALTWADIDECVWNWHPRSQGDGANTGFTSHKGNFYRSPFVDARGTTWTRVLTNAVNGHGSHEAFIDLMKSYSTDTFPSGRTWAINNGEPRGYGYQFVAQEAKDTGVPTRPTLAYVGPPGFPAQDLRFQSSLFRAGPTGGTTFSASQWRVGEISAPGIPLYDPTEPRIYEIESVWTSPELSMADGTTRIPFAAIRPGHTYRARVRHQDANGRWSRWSEPVQFVPTTPDASVYKRDLVISEIMYQPPSANVTELAKGFSGEDFEFIRLMNIGAVPLDLTDVRFTKGINFDFAAGFTLDPGATCYVVRNPAAFQSRYGTGKNVAGSYGPDNLSNTGERIKLSYGGGITIYDFDYLHLAPWPDAAGGVGYSLQLIAPTTRPDPSVPANWQVGISWAAWSAAHGGATDPLLNGDGDGLTTLLEYALGGDPQVASSTNAAMVELIGNQLAVTFRRPAGASDLKYELEFSSDLLDWTGGAVLSSATTNPDRTVTETWRSPLALNNGRQFVRLRVTLL